VLHLIPESRLKFDDHIYIKISKDYQMLRIIKIKDAGEASGKERRL